ncbi:MAG: VanZ family protein, partial [Candidatus Rokuibacteriota bacterium]
MKLHLGYGVAAVGYMVGIFFMTSVPEGGTISTPGPPAFWNFMHVPLFAGLASCLLLAVSNGEWRRRIPIRMYAVIILVAATYAGFDEWRQAAIGGRHASLEDVLLNLT